VPTTTEVVSNRPLAGTELKEIILEDVKQMLDNDGMLSFHIAYGRVAYEVNIKLMMDNPAFPESKTATAATVNVRHRRWCGPRTPWS